LLPAVLASRTAPIPALKRDAASQGFRRSRFGAVFLVAQVSISGRRVQRHLLTAIGLYGALALAAGLALGLVSAIALERLMNRFLYGITPSDPLTYGVATVFVGAVALAACAVPAWRAARVDPMVALRSE